MAMCINRVLLTGNLTKDPELRTTQSGTPVCSMRIAVNGREKVGDSWRDRADYFDITVWGNQAESCAQYLSKGSPLAVDGRLRLDQWEKDGQKHSTVKIVADTVQFLRGRDEGQQQAASAGGGQEFRAPQADFSGGADDDIPF